MSKADDTTRDGMPAVTGKMFGITIDGADFLILLSALVDHEWASMWFERRDYTELQDLADDMVVSAELDEKAQAIHRSDAIRLLSDWVEQGLVSWTADDLDDDRRSDDLIAR